MNPCIDCWLEDCGAPDVFCDCNCHSHEVELPSISPPSRDETSADMNKRRAPSPDTLSGLLSGLLSHGEQCAQAPVSSATIVATFCNSSSASHGYQIQATRSL